MLYYCLSSAINVARTRLRVRLCVHCLACIILAPKPVSTNWLFLWRFQCNVCLWVSFCILHAIIDSYFVSSHYGVIFYFYAGCLYSFAALSFQAPYSVSSEVILCNTHFLTYSFRISASLLEIFLLLWCPNSYFGLQLRSLNASIYFSTFFY